MPRPAALAIATNEAFAAEAIEASSAAPPRGAPAHHRPIIPFTTSRIDIVVVWHVVCANVTVGRARRSGPGKEDAMRAPRVGELRRDMELLTLEGKKDAFLRSVRLPMAVDASTVTATFKSGVLVVTLPKTPASKTSRG